MKALSSPLQFFLIILVLYGIETKSLTFRGTQRVIISVKGTYFGYDAPDVKKSNDEPLRNEASYYCRRFHKFHNQTYFAMYARN